MKLYLDTMKDKRLCSSCDGNFTPTKGKLEKRCPSCQFLKIQKGENKYLIEESVLYTSLLRKITRVGVQREGLVLFDESVLYDELGKSLPELSFTSFSATGNPLQENAERVDFFEYFMCTLLRKGFSKKEISYVSAFFKQGIDSLEELSNLLNMSPNQINSLGSSVVKKMKQPSVLGLIRELYN